MKREAPAAARNRDPIADVLADELPDSGTVLELASGTGEHVIHFAARFPALQWQPSDPDADALASIAAWSGEAGLTNIAPPLELDASSSDWPVGHADAILCINMVHISTVAATEGLVRAAGRILPTGAPLILYGPYLEEDVETAESNIAFDGWLKQRNPEWGLRRAEWLDEIAAAQGLARTRRVAMPANNIMLVYRRS
jgi:SAM-dependent methyltransferase